MTLYNIDKKLASQEDRIHTARYSESNKELIFKFERFLFLEGLTKVRVLKYLNQLNLIADNFDFELCVYSLIHYSVWQDLKIKT